VFADGIVDGRQASPLLEPVTKVEVAVALVAGAATAVEARDVAVVPAEAVDGALPADVELEAVERGAVEPAAVELGAVELAAVELGAAEPAAVVVLAELSEPQPPRAARRETHTNPAHAFNAPILKTIVTCPITA
jgi:hypothetical protein